MNVLTKSIATTITALAWAATASAESFPVAQDSFGSVTKNTIAKVNGKAVALPVNNKSTAYMNFNFTSAGYTANQVTAARLIIYIPQVTRAGTLNISALTSGFPETFTASSVPSPTTTTTVASIALTTTMKKTFVVVNVTGLVQAWGNGFPEFGIAINSDGTAAGTIGSKEGAATGYPAVLEVDIANTNAAGNTALAGLVGIGTSAPSQLLDVAGTDGQFVVHPYFGGTGTTLLASFSSPDADGAQLRFGRTGDFMDIGQNGSGEFVVENKFDAPVLKAAEDGTVTINGGNNNTGRLNLNSPGFGNVATTQRARPGDLYLAYYEDQTGNFVGGWTNALGPAITLYSGGDAAKPGGGSWAVSSDLRLKKNVESLSGVLDKLMQLRSVSFEYKDPAAIREQAGQQIGFIAQEVEKVFPNWVGQKQDGYKYISTKGFESLTVAALRELRDEKDAQITTLKTENAALRKQLAENEARDSALEARLARLETTAPASTVNTTAPAVSNGAIETK